MERFRASQATSQPKHGFERAASSLPRKGCVRSNIPIGDRAPIEADLLARQTTVKNALLWTGRDSHLRAGSIIHSLSIENTCDKIMHPFHQSSPIFCFVRALMDRQAHG